MDSMKIGALAMLTLAALHILRAYKPEWAPLVRIAATVTLFGGMLTTVGTLLTALTDPELLGGTPTEELQMILIKALGIAFLTEAAAAVCRDSGENGLSDFVETAGKLEILLLSLPLVRAVLALVRELLAISR